MVVGIVGMEGMEDMEGREDMEGKDAIEGREDIEGMLVGNDIPVGIVMVGIAIGAGGRLAAKLFQVQLMIVENTGGR